MRLLLTLLALLLWPGQAEARAQRIAVSLVASTGAPKPSSTVTLGLRFRPQPGWHGYWTNPGDSGLAPQAEWIAPAGLKFGPLQHPAPTILRVAGITSYVHAGEHVLLTLVRVPASLAAGTKIPIKATLNWLACSDSLCVPERAVVQVDLVIGDGPSSADAAVIRRAQTDLPKVVAAPGHYTLQGGNFRFSLPTGVTLDASRARLFPDGNGFLDAATIRIAAGAAGELTGRASGSPPATIGGVLSDGRKAYRVHFARGVLPATQAPATDDAFAASPRAGEGIVPDPIKQGRPTTAVAALRLTDGAVPEAQATGEGRSSALPLVSAVLGAIAGGLLLNLMPCVFPMLSLKALQLARSGKSQRDTRREALGYTAGALLGTGLLGLSIALLRQAGVEVGWSFQLQNPAVVFFLLLLTFGIALNLAGLFELPSLSVESAASSGGVAASISTGALAAFIATPCSGPFMATALGTALLLPAAEAMLIFLGLGLGLALPFLIIAFIPASRRYLPKPGPWMGTFRRILAMPMLLTAVGLLWLVGRQGGTQAMTAAAVALLSLAIGLWWVGLRQRGGRERSWVPVFPAAAGIALAMIAAPPQAAAAAVAPAPRGVEAFSETRLAALRRAGPPIFVDFTADWCLTCKVNERVAIDREATQAAFQRAGVVTLKGDWTNGDPAITRFLTRNGRNSIPFYLFVGPGRQPEVLPQILTPTILIERASPATT